MRHHVTLKHLRCFLAVAETGSFTLAAARLFLTQSALTATIQQFEQAVGVRLFERTTRRVALTNDGERFRPEAELLVTRFDSAVGDLMALAQGHAGHIRIGAAASVIYQFLVHAIQRFRAAYPDITVSLRDPAALQAERLVLEGAVDFAIEGKYQGFDGLDYTPLVADRYGVVCHADSVLARSSGPLRWSELTPERYVAYSADTGIGQFLLRHAEQWPVLGGAHDEVASTTALLAMVSTGAGYSVLPALALKSREFPELVFRELHDPPLQRELCVITRKLRSLSLSTRRLLDTLLDEVRARPLPQGVSVIHAAG